MGKKPKLLLLFSAEVGRRSTHWGLKLRLCMGFKPPLITLEQESSAG